MFLSNSNKILNSASKSREETLFFKHISDNYKQIYLRERERADKLRESSTHKEQMWTHKS